MDLEKAYLSGFYETAGVVKRGNVYGTAEAVPFV
jgi:hypothetical protein